MRGAKATAPTNPKMCLYSLCQHPRLGAWRCWRCTPKTAPPGPWGCPVHPLPPPGAPSDLRMLRDAHGALEGTKGGSSHCPGSPSIWCQPGGESPGWQRAIAAQKSAGVGRVGICQLFLPPMPLAPTLLPRRGTGTAGAPQNSARLPPPLWAPFPARERPRGLQSTLPIQERWEQLPWDTTQGPSPSVGTQGPSPAETPNSSHQWWRRGRTGRLQYPLRGPHRGQALYPLPNSARGRAGAGPDPEPRRVFPAPVPVQEAPEQPRLRPRAQCWEQGAGQGLRDMGTCPRAQCLIAFQHHPGQGKMQGDPAVPVSHTPGLNPDPQGKMGAGCAALLCWGFPSSPAAGGHWQPPSQGGFTGHCGAAGSQDHCSALPARPSGLRNICPQAPK